MTARTIMVQGTSSYAGKSFIAMCLCRIFSRRGFKVAPFKSQNTALNSYVTRDGFEISRAQAIQAFAAGIEPSVDMNPILVKPKGEHKAQIVVRGKPLRDIEAYEYYRDFALKEGIPILEESFRRLKEEYDIIVIEGAGSPAEINLYDQDISNMKVARIADSPVIIVADIDRGGVFANIFGTLALLEAGDRDRVKGFVINKFRGDMKILEPGIRQIEEMTGKPILGVIPYIMDLRLPSEDSLGIPAVSRKKADIDIAVIKLPRIANFTDLDPLIYEDNVLLRFVERPQDLGSPQAIIIPGTKNTTQDLIWFREMGFDNYMEKFLGKIPVLGICGGYQMMGKNIQDPDGLEGEPGEYDGLGILNTSTTFELYEKTTKRTHGKARNNLTREDITISGYEVHMGQTRLGENTVPLFEIDGKPEGALDKGKLAMGTYFHGIFDAPDFRKDFLSLASKGVVREKAMEIEEIWNESIHRASDIIEKSLDLDSIIGFMDDLRSKKKHP